MSIISTHRSTMYVHVAYCYRPKSVVSRSVCLSQQWALQRRLNRSRCRMGWGLRWAKELHIRWGFRSSHGNG